MLTLLKPDVCACVCVCVCSLKVSLVLVFSFQVLFLYLSSTILFVVMVGKAFFDLFCKKVTELLFPPHLLCIMYNVLIIKYRAGNL